MRQLLVTTLFIGVIIMIYTVTIGGSTGAKSEFIQSGIRVGAYIQSINP